MGVRGCQGARRGEACPMELPDEPRAGGDGAAWCAEGGAAHPQEYLALTRPRQPTGSKLLQVPIGKFPANGAGNQPFWLKKLPQPFWLEQQSNSCHNSHSCTNSCTSSCIGAAEWLPP